MDTQSDFGFKELFHYVVGEMAKAVSERGGETKSQQFMRFEAASHMIMGFLPRDVIEAMLAGHCVMFHELINDSVRDTLRGEVDTMRRATRSSIVAMDKAFASNLAQFERYRRRPSRERRDEPDTQMEPEIAMTPHAAVEAAPPPMHPLASPPEETPEMPAQSQPEPTAGATEGIAVLFRPSPDIVEACRGNPEALAALEAGDPERFMLAMGLDMPTEADLLKAQPGSVFTIDASGVRLDPGGSKA